MKDFKAYLFLLLLFIAAIGVGGVIFTILTGVIGMIFSESPVTDTVLSVISGIGSIITVAFFANMFNKYFNNFWDKVYN